MKISSPIISAGSGSLAGLTASHNRGGLYLRARAIPTNPNSAGQVTVRNAMTTLVNRWTGVLTAVQRSAWTVYADNTPVTDSLGAQINLTGQQMYIRSNVSRIQAGDPIIDDAPIIFNLGDFTPPGSVITAATDLWGINFSAGDAWVSEDGAFLYAYGSRPQNVTVNYFTGPYRFLGKIAGDSGAPPVPPLTLPTIFAYGLGNKGFIKYNVARADGRYSSPIRDSAIAT